MEAFLPEPMCLAFSTNYKYIYIYKTRETMLEVTLLPFYLLLLKAINFNSNKETQGITRDQLCITLSPTLEHCHCIIQYIQFYLPLSIFSSTGLITFYFSVAIAARHSDSQTKKSALSSLQISPGSPNFISRYIPKGHLNFH